MKSRYELLRHGGFMLPCCLIMALFLSACAEQMSEAKKQEIELATANDMSKQADREIIGKDGAKMLLIPAGDFMMGSSTEGRADEEPVHHVSLDAFYLDKYEVTNKLFQKFVRETGYETTAEKEGRAAAVTSGGQWEVIPGANWRKPEGERRSSSRIARSIPSSPFPGTMRRPTAVGRTSGCRRRRSLNMPAGPALERSIGGGTGTPARNGLRTSRMNLPNGNFPTCRSWWVMTTAMNARRRWGRLTRIPGVCTI